MFCFDTHYRTCFSLNKKVRGRRLQLQYSNVIMIGAVNMTTVFTEASSGRPNDWNVARMVTGEVDGYVNILQDGSGERVPPFFIFFIVRFPLFFMRTCLARRLLTFYPLQMESFASTCEI
jgi:hypothetical protein